MIDDYAQTVKDLREVERMERYLQPLIAVLAAVLFLIIGKIAVPNVI